MPSFNYTLNVNSNNGSTKLIKFIMIDTNLFCGLKTPANTAPRYRAIKHQQWVRHQVEKAFASEYKFLILVGHHPVWAVAEHGPTQCLVEKLRPLLHLHQVNAYFSGHEHDMEYLQEQNMFFPNLTANYIISGAGGTPYFSNENIDKVPNDTLKFYWAQDPQINGAYVYVNANEHNISIEYLESNGKLLYKTVLKQFDRFDRKVEI